MEEAVSAWQEWAAKLLHEAGMQPDDADLDDEVARETIARCVRAVYRIADQVYCENAPNEQCHERWPGRPALWCAACIANEGLSWDGRP